MTADDIRNELTAAENRVVQLRADLREAVAMVWLEAARAQYPTPEGAWEEVKPNLRAIRAGHYSVISRIVTEVVGRTPRGGFRLLHRKQWADISKQSRWSPEDLSVFHVENVTISIRHCEYGMWLRRFGGDK